MAMREAHEDGKIPTEELAQLGFVLGANVVDRNGVVYKIAEMSDAKVVHLHHLPGSDEYDKDITRMQLLGADWKLKEKSEEEGYLPSELLNPCLTKETQTNLWKGRFTEAMVSAYQKHSHDNHVKILKKPEVNVVALKGFQVGKLTLVGLTNTFTCAMLKAPLSTSSSAVDLGKVVETPDGALNLIAQPALKWPREGIKDTAITRQDEFLVSYWGVKRVCDAAEANMGKEQQEVPLKVGSEARIVHVPIMRNTKVIEKGDILKVALKTEMEDESSDDAPTAPKRPRIAKGGRKGHNKKATK